MQNQFSLFWELHVNFRVLYVEVTYLAENVLIHFSFHCDFLLSLFSL